MVARSSQDRSVEIRSPRFSTQRHHYVKHSVRMENRYDSLKKMINLYENTCRNRINNR